MFLRLAAQYQDLVKDLVLTLEALAEGLKDQGVAASCYSCGTDGSHGASFVADMNDGHAVRFLVTGLGITWVEMRNGFELVKLEGAEAIEFLDRFSAFELHQFNAVAHFNPGDAKASHQKTNGMAVVHVGHE